MRQLSIRMLAALGIAAVLAGCGGADDSSPADAFMNDPAALARGKGLFTGTCGAYCHSPQNDARDAPYLFDCQWLHGGSDVDIFNTISTGVPGTRMIGFGGKMPEGDQDIWKIIAYLKANRAQC